MHVHRRRGVERAERTRRVEIGDVSDDPEGEIGDVSYDPEGGDR
jgi:hypothetical protein